ncbi:MAG TPA: hypothetical protein VFW66_08580 [Gemmatimonadales bacterium]|nr:hypothetical protein [Gemmatimonadales bacterium]
MQRSHELPTTTIARHFSKRTSAHILFILGGACAAALAVACSDSAPTAPTAQVARQIAPPAFALSRGPGKPEHFPIPGSVLDFAPGDVCAFGVHGETVKSNSLVTSYPPAENGDITQRITGQFVETLTNTSNGKSMTANLPGPLTFTYHVDGSATLVLTGTTQLFFFPTDIPAGPKLIINSGRAVVTFTPSGQEVLESISGTQEDVCAALS